MKAHSRHDKLIPYLLLAMAVHTLVLYCLKIPLPHPLTAQPPLTLEVDLFEPPVPVPRKPVLEHSPPAMQQTRQPSNTLAGNTPVLAKPVDTASSPAPATTIMTESPLQTPRVIVTQTLLDAARTMGKEDEKSHPSQQSIRTPLADRPILAKLANVLAEQNTSQPGITQYADGTIKVVTAYGTVYCTKTPPDLAKTGPLAQEAMAMTCP